MSKSIFDRRVLIVDDLPSLRMLVTDMLRDMGFVRLAEASSAVEALQVVNAEKPGLIICDYCMRGMTGPDLIKVLRRDPDMRRVPVIMLSNNRDVPLIDTAINAGADDYIVKPVSFQILKRRIEDVLRRNGEQEAVA